MSHHVVVAYLITIHSHDHGGSVANYGASLRAIHSLGSLLHPSLIPRVPAFLCPVPLPRHRCLGRREPTWGHSWINQSRKRRRSAGRAMACVLASQLCKGGVLRWRLVRERVWVCYVRVSMHESACRCLCNLFVTPTPQFKWI